MAKMLPIWEAENIAKVGRVENSAKFGRAKSIVILAGQNVAKPPVLNGTDLMVPLKRGFFL